MFIYIGSLAFGTVWGWLAVLVGGRPLSLRHNFWPLVLASAGVLATLYVIYGRDLTLFFAAGALLGAMLHYAFLQGLQQRKDNS